MTRTLALIGLIAACNSDYELKGDIENPEGLPEEALDTADPIEPEPEPEPDPDAPVAVCSVSPDVVRPITDSASFLGSESYDPAGLELEYDWKLVDRPVGSTASPSPPPTLPNVSSSASRASRVSTTSSANRALR